MNALDELTRHCNNVGSCIECAWLDIQKSSVRHHFTLPRNFNPQQLKDFYEGINQEYADGSPFQELYGVVWWVDGSWSERRVMANGREMWNHIHSPSIPEELW